MTTRPTPFDDLNTVLAELVHGVSEILGDNMIGVYLQGSFALGDADRHSDVDFLTVIRNEITEPHLPLLQAMHARIFADPCPWAQHLEGSYVPADALRHFSPTDTFWYIDNGSDHLIRSAHDNTLVVRRVFREHGIALVGPPPAQLLDPVPVDALRHEIRATMREWAAELLADPDRMNNRWYQPFVVISYCRMLYSLETGLIASKPISAQWAMQTLEPAWGSLIERALAERPDPSRKVRLPADPDDLARTMDFIDFALTPSDPRVLG